MTNIEKAQEYLNNLEAELYEMIKDKIPMYREMKATVDFTHY